MTVRPILGCMAVDTEVLVVGAGPTGLLLAGDLARAGVRCTLLERRVAESNLTRAFAVHARTLEILDARGIGDELAATGARLGRLRIFGRLEVDLSRLPTRYPYVLVTPQYTTEEMLGGYLRAHGGTLVTGAEVVGLRQDADGVEADVRRDDGSRVTYRARYLVGADGAGSFVRRALGLAFPGRAAVQSVLLADVRLEHQPPDVLTVNAVGDGFAFLAPFGDGWYRVIAWNRRRQLPDTAPVDFAEVKEIVRAVLGTDYGMHSPRWTSRFHSDERQVAHYRVGRVFLAGDAAHIHSPAGGQGMNTSIQDAANLGWKLAEVLRGRGGEELLDSYQAERHPVGRAVLRGSGVALRLAMVQSRRSRLARATVRSVAGQLESVPAPAARAVSGIGISYPTARGGHRLVGRRAPDVRLRHAGGPERLYEALRDGRFVLLAHRDPIARVDGREDQMLPATVDDAMPAAAVLVRPDGYVAWAGDEEDST